MFPRGIGHRALSNGINSAVFFCFFEALRSSFAKRKEQVGTLRLADCLTQLILRCSVTDFQAILSAFKASYSFIKGTWRLLLTAFMLTSADSDEWLCVQAHARALAVQRAAESGESDTLVRTRTMREGEPEFPSLGELQPASASLALSFKPGTSKP